jgi:hypothetical protein
MPLTVDGHVRRLQFVCAALLASLGVYGAVVMLIALPSEPTFPQGEPLLWGFAFFAAVNLVTIMPVYRAIMATPRRVYAVGQDPQRLLAAHFAAHLVAFARIEAVAMLGVVLYVLTGHRDWFWIFTAIAGVGMLLLWPSRAKVRELVVISSPLGPEAASPR